MCQVGRCSSRAASSRRWLAASPSALAISVNFISGCAVLIFSRSCGGARAQGGGQRPSQGKGEKQREFFVYEGKVFNYPKPGATKVTASSAPLSSEVASISLRMSERGEGKILMEAPPGGAAEGSMLSADPGAEAIMAG